MKSQCIRFRICTLIMCACFVVMAVQAETTPSILIKNGNTYQYNGQNMDKAAYRLFLQNECPQAWKQYKQGRECAIAGWTLFGAGLVGAPISAAFGFVSGFGKSSAPTPPAQASAVSYVCLGVFALSNAMVVTSIPLLAVGYTFMDKSVDTFNQQCKQTPLELSFQMTGNGVGFALRF